MPGYAGSGHGFFSAQARGAHWDQWRLSKPPDVAAPPPSVLWRLQISLSALVGSPILVEVGCRFLSLVGLSSTCFMGAAERSAQQGLVSPSGFLTPGAHNEKMCLK